VSIQSIYGVAFAGAAVAMSLAGAPAMAQSEDSETGLQGRAAFSYAEARGNTDTLAITGESELKYLTDSPWQYDAKLGFVTREESDARTEERYEVILTANRYWTEHDYMFGRLSWRKDNFGGVVEEWLPSIGYGRLLIDLERHQLTGEVGVGYRFADLSDGTSEEGVALSGGARYTWQISESAQFFQNVLVQWTTDNTYAESETGLSTVIVGNLNARVSYRVRHNTDVPADTRNSDFLTTIGIDYKF